MARKKRVRKSHQNNCRVFPNFFSTFLFFPFIGFLFLLPFLVSPVQSSDFEGDNPSSPTPSPTSPPVLLSSPPSLSTFEYNSSSSSSSPSSSSSSLSPKREEPSVLRVCNSTLTERWPPNPPGPTLVLGVLMTQVGFIIKERLGLKIPGMISYAVEYVNDKKILPDNYTLQIEFRDTKGDEILSTKHVTDMVCQNISAFIGPESSCWVEASIAEAQNIPMISYACPDNKASMRKTFARTNPSEIHILRATLKTIVYFKWKKFSILYDENGFATMAKTMYDLATREQLIINHNIPFNDVKEFPNIFMTTKDETRIYVLIGHRESVSRALLAMTLSGLLKATKKDYFLLFVDREEFKEEDWTQFIFEPTTVAALNVTDECLSKDLQSYEDGFMIVSNTLPTKKIDQIERITRDYNKKEPFCLASDVTKVLRRRKRSLQKEKEQVHVPFLSASYLYDAVVQYAEAVRALYNDMKSSGGNHNGQKINVADLGRDGAKVAEKLTNWTFQSILGFQVKLGADRASEGSYSIYYFQNSEACKKINNQYKWNCTTHCLLNSSYFQDGELITNITIPIKDEPICGYKDDRCQTKTHPPRFIVLMVLLGGVLFFTILSIQKYRHWKYEQEISGLLWRIDKEELKFSQSDFVNLSKMSILSGVSLEGNYAYFVTSDRRATYRGTVCCIKTISLECRKQELSRETMKKMRSMREIKHRNVCPFIGAYVEERKLTLITEYANRGSLEDILENEDIKLDALFISSLTQDLLRAMCFLHQSFGPHGNLKSPNCVVTGRWVLQVTDYDLHELRYEANKAIEKEIADDENAIEERKKSLKSCLWKAPEFLRQEGMYVPATKEGDVYAFGIILHEIIGRKGPFSTSDNNGDPDFEGIINDVKKGEDVSGNLRRPCTLDLAMGPFESNYDVIAAMKASWAENPKSRPDFKELTARLKIMKKNENLVDHMVLILEEHNKNLEGLVRERTQEVMDEKRKTEELLHSMLPSPVAMNLCRNIPVEPQSYESVTIYFSDIVGFTALASASSPYQIVSFLDDLYREFDTTISGFDVYKVETIGDAYMVVSGLPNKNEGRHAGEIASMSLELLELTKSFKIKHKPDQILKLRIGLHTGPVIAGVVGHTMPRYCLFGDTVNTASRMESNGQPLRIHISEPCKNALENLGGYIIEERGYVEMKGKGAVLTFWLNAATDKAIRRVERPAPTMSFFQRHPEDGRELRRRSPRLSIDLRVGERRRTPSMSSRTNRESDVAPALNDSPQREFGLANYHRQLLNHHHRTNSLESPTRRGLLSPPQGTTTMDDGRTPSSGSVRESQSLDNFPAKISPLSIPHLKGIRLSSSPSNSEPTLVPEEHPRVNFCPSSRFKDEEGNEAEMNPMLEGSITEEYDSEDDRPESPLSAKKASVMRNLLQSILSNGKRERFNSEKSSLNGFQRESHV